jgi:hypothetical protein
MALKLKQEPLREELRSDDETLRRVMALALELQGRRDGTYSLAEMERIGAEIGVEPEFVRQAHAQVAATSPRPKQNRQHWRQQRDTLVAAWWSAAWVVPVIIASGMPSGRPSGVPLVLFFLSLVVYIGGGILFTHFLSQADSTDEEATLPGDAASGGTAQ